MKTQQTLAVSGALLALVLAPVASAAVLVDYKMTAAGDPLTGAATTAPTSTAANVSATSIVNQAGGTFTAFSGGSNNYNVGTDRVTIWGTATGSATSYANAFTAGSYITFSVTAAPGFNITLSSITFQASSGSSNATSDRAFYLVSASAPADFSATSTVLATDRTAFGGGTMPLQNATAINTVPKDYSADLTSLGAITSGNTQYFRFYLQTPGSNQGIAFDDIVVNGTVSAVPEPSSYAALAGVAALGLVALRRRQRA